MTCFSITIDGQAVRVTPGQTVLSVARSIGIDIPTLCYLEKCGPLTSCLVCLVKINGKMVPSCGTRAEPGMVVESETTEVHEARRTALELLLSEHVGDCLAPCNRLCPLQLNIPVLLRQMQAGKLEEAGTTVREALPLAGVLGRLCHHPCEQGCRRGTCDQAAGIRELERLAADWRAPNSSGFLPAQKPASGKTVVVIGAGPTGLAAAYDLLRQGHACTIADRHPSAGGSLRRELDSGALPREVLAAELKLLEQLGAQFRLGAVLGQDITLEGLARGFDAVLVATGEISRSEGESWGLEMTSGGIKAHPETCQTNVPGVFAAGRAVKPVNQLVRAMSEGRVAATCIHQFLCGSTLGRPAKPFSSILGRVEPEELHVLLAGASPATRLQPREPKTGFTHQEAAAEAFRCLHCDCRSAGDCSLQHYAQTYGADAGRYRQGRRKLEQHVQPAGVIFEPGKCILCGICVKLCGLAQEPLGLSFVGRGFDVRVATPFNRTLEEGLQKVAAECVEHCPTGALAWAVPPGKRG